MISPFTDFFAYHHNDDDHGFQNNYQNNNKDDDDNNNNNNSSNNSGNWVPITVSEAAYPVSPSSFLTTPCAFSPSILLGSPLANNFTSPTVGAYGGESFNWGGSNEMTHQGAKVDGRNNHFSFNGPNIPTEGCANSEEPKKQNNMINKVSNSQFPQNKNLPQELISKTQTDPQPVVQINRSQKISEDGYCWRKYGQKLVKGRENPRSYYKCSYPNCPTKKKVESSKQGFIIEIVYRGSHNHHKPQSGRISSSSSLSSVVQNCFNSIVFDGSEGSNASSVFVDDDDDELEDQSFGMSRSGKDDGSEREAKRWKGENEGEVISGYGSRTVREPNVIVQTRSEIDMLDDGYRWRKYGQKVVKGNPNPRSYYKCTGGGCLVRKHIERASNDTRAVITTYEGKHNHDVPAARGRSSSSSSNNSNAPLILPVRPAVIVSQPKQITDFNNLSNCTKPDSAHQSPFILQMLQSPESFDSSGFGNPLGTKEVAKDNTFDLESFLP